MKKNTKKCTRKDVIRRFIEIHGFRYDYILVNYISMHFKVIIICKEHGQFLQTPHNHLKGQNCDDCAKIERNNHFLYSNQFIDDSLLKNGILIKRISDSVSSNQSILWECLICHHLWNTSANYIVREVTGCPKCNDTKLNNDDIDELLIDRKKGLIRLDDYINIYTKIRWQCLNCLHIWSAQPCEITRKRNGGSGCPKCSRHKNEKLVHKFLINNNINFEYQKCIKLTKKNIFPDFYIQDMNLILEYNGVQHYVPTCFGSMTQQEAEECFEIQQKRDSLLKEYCDINKITLLEIDGREYKDIYLEEFLSKYFKINENKAM